MASLVDRLVYVETTRMWYVMKSLPGDNYAIQFSGVLPGTKTPEGVLMPNQPDSTHDVLPNRVALERLLASLGY